jgi:GNAT superfamily N-acetyltransferase
MIQTKLINTISEFFEYTQIVTLLKQQMEHIGTPKSNEEIKETIKLMFDTDSAFLMVLENNGLLLGFVFFNVAIGLQSSGKYLWLNEMHINEQFRGKGYGTMLFNGLKKWAKENNIVRIMGIVDNVDPRTRKFYLNQGTEITKEEILSIRL